MSGLHGEGVKGEDQLIGHINDEESLDELILGDYKVIQARAGYRFSLDAVLLAHFASLEMVQKAVDLGTGNGVIPLLLAARAPELHVVGIELQTAMVDRARRSIFLNCLQDRISIVEADVRQAPSIMPEAGAQLVVCNPPFMCAGQGRVPHNREKALARHELAATLADFVTAASHLLDTGGGFCLIHRSERLLEAVDLFHQNKLGVVRLRMVHAFKEREAGLVLLEGSKGTRDHLTILPPLVIYRQTGVYSPEVMQWYKKEL